MTSSFFFTAILARTTAKRKINAAVVMAARMKDYSIRKGKGLMELYTTVEPEFLAGRRMMVLLSRT